MQVGKLINHGLSLGADYVEIFRESTKTSFLNLLDSHLETVSSGERFGIGIRLLYGTQVRYTYANTENIETLLDLISQISESTQQRNKQKIDESFELTKPPAWKIRSDLQERISLLRNSDNRIRKIDAKINQVSVCALETVRDISIVSNEKPEMTDQQIRSRYIVSVTAGNGNDLITTSESMGALTPFSKFDPKNCFQHADNAAERALRMLNASYIDAREMPVVMGNGFGGVIFHEACGHPLETEAIRKDASPFVNKIGQKIAHPKLTAIDDGTIEESWGSIQIDDEGTPSQKTVLIKDGILKTFLSDKVGAKETGVPLSGSSRRESYKYAPVARMRNTYIASGDDSFDEMISSVEHGLYALKMGGGSVNPATGEFNFAVEEGYEIKNGKIDRPVRGASLIGRGHEILPKISMIGSDLELATGMCGASSGTIPVTVGQPTLKVDSILVGGRS